MKTRVLLLAIISLTFLLSGAAVAQQLFDYFGMALLPAAEGESATMYGVIRDGSPAIETPLPLDFANFEYTLVVTDLVLVADEFPEVYANGTIAIYQDAGTTADYAATGTFTDGTAFLTGVITTLTLYHYSDVSAMTNGSGSGLVTWTGGTNLNDMAPEDMDDWAFLVTSNSASGELEAGYDEVWDGKVEPEGPIVDTDRVSWDEIKAMF